MDPVAARLVQYRLYCHIIIIPLTNLCNLNSGGTVEPPKGIVGCAARVEVAGTSKLQIGLPARRLVDLVTQIFRLQMGLRPGV
jgi:hypothetical protein